MRNADSSSNGTWKYPFTVSWLAKHFTDAVIDCRMSFVLGKGCTGRSMNLLSEEKSVTSLIFLLGFGMKNAWQHNGVGSVTLVMMPWSMSFLMYRVLTRYRYPLKLLY